MRPQVQHVCNRLMPVCADDVPAGDARVGQKDEGAGHGLVRAVLGAVGRLAEPEGAVDRVDCARGGAETPRPLQRLQRGAEGDRFANDQHGIISAVRCYSA